MDYQVWSKSEDEIMILQLDQDNSWIPVLTLVHQCNLVKVYRLDPDILPSVQVDQGAIKFILKGADIMCPGLTSAGIIQ